MDRDWVFVSVPKQPRHGGSWFIILSWEQKKNVGDYRFGKIDDDVIGSGRG